MYRTNRMTNERSGRKSMARCAPWLLAAIAVCLASQARATTLVSILANRSIVGSEPITSCAWEPEQLRLALGAEFTCQLFEDYSAASIAARLSAGEIVAVPDQETSSIVAAWGASGALVRTALQAGGRLLVFGDASTRDIELLNLMLSGSPATPLANGPSSSFSGTRTAAAPAEFATCPSSLAWVDGTYSVVGWPSSDVFYAGGSEVGVAASSVGAGRLGFIAYDFYCPDGGTDVSGWISVTRAMVRHLTGCRPASSMKQANAAWAGAWYGASTNGAGGIDLIDPWKARLEAAIAAASTDETQASSQVGSLVAPSVALDLDGNGVRGNREDLVRLLAFFQPGASNRRPNYNLGSVGCAITSLVNAANALKGLNGASQHTPGQLYELLRVPRPGGELRGISPVGNTLKRWSGEGVVPRFDGMDLRWDTAAADLGVTHQSLSSVNLDVIADHISSCRKVVVYMNGSHWVLLDGVRGEGAAREFLVNDPGSSAGPGNGISWISGQVIASKASRAKLIATRAFGPQLVSPPISLCVRVQDGGKALLTDPLVGASARVLRVGTFFSRHLAMSRAACLLEPLTIS